MHYGLPEYYAISVGLLRNPDVDVLAHPLWGLDFLYPAEYKESCRDEFPEIYIRDIMKIAAEENKAIELNSAEVGLLSEKWFYYGREFGTKYSIGSDAHLPERIGDIEKSIEVANKYGIDDDKFITGRVS
jgi:putative hydrolase